jgi:hypothetical protein
VESTTIGHIQSEINLFYMSISHLCRFESFYQDYIHIHMNIILSQKSKIKDLSSLKYIKYYFSLYFLNFTRPLAV